DDVANQQDVPFAEHVETFVNRRTKRAPNGITRVGRNNSRSRLTRLANECGFRVLSDLRPELLDRWMRNRLADGMSPANINEFRNELVIFANWCVRTKRLLVNPCNDVPKLDAPRPLDASVEPCPKRSWSNCCGSLVGVRLPNSAGCRGKRRPKTTRP